MLMQFLFAVCVLGVVIVGLLLMMQVISIELLGNTIWRGSLVVVISVIVLCVFKGFLLPILICWLVRLKQMFLWIAMVVLVLVLVISLLVVRMLILKSTKRLPTSGSHDQGEP
jgi:hypothetical protein